MRKFLLLSFFLFIVNMIYAQDRRITGVVKEKENGSPIPGVTVKVKKNSVATATDADGNFSIQASSSSTLVFSSIGFISKEV